MSSSNIQATRERNHHLMNLLNLNLMNPTHQHQQLFSSSSPHKYDSLFFALPPRVKTPKARNNTPEEEDKEEDKESES
jgi:hypothetical protein